MKIEAPSIELPAWLETPPGRYLLAWEQAQMDAAVADLFGFHALQLGWPALQGLRTNRMQHRWLALAQPSHGAPPPPSAPAVLSTPPSALAPVSIALHCEFDALPFESNSLDLVVLPHALELSHDPHQTLREVERVLRPEGRVVILGLNPVSLWGLRQNLGRLTLGQPHSFLPLAGDAIGYWRLRDWLRLLNLEVEGARFGCYSPPLRSDAWLQRWAWVEGVGGRWWPVLGAAYFIVAVKRVRGMRLLGLARSHKTKAKTAPVIALHQQTRKDQ